MVSSGGFRCTARNCCAVNLDGHVDGQIRRIGNLHVAICRPFSGVGLQVPYPANVMVFIVARNALELSELVQLTDARFSSGRFAVRILAKLVYSKKIPDGGIARNGVAVENVSRSEWSGCRLPRS